MAEALFPPGTVVQLRSGGPHLTVTKTVVYVYVAYHNPVTGLFAEASFPEEALRSANQAPAVPEHANSLRNTTVAKSSM